MYKSAVSLICGAILMAIVPAAPGHSEANNVPEQLLAQSPLLDIASPIQERALELISSTSIDSSDPFKGFAGVDIDVANMRVDLYWAGQMGKEVSAKLNQAPPNVEIRIHPSPWSLFDEYRESLRLESSSILKAKVGFSVSPSDDGQGLMVLQPYPAHFTTNEAKDLKSETAMQVAFTSATPVHLENSRESDASPYSGGAKISIDHIVECSSGIGVKSSISGVNYMLTANHCFSQAKANGQSTATIYNGVNSSGFWDAHSAVGTWQNTGPYNYPDMDVSIYRPSPGISSSNIYFGSASSSSLLKLTKVFSPVKGETVCTDGAVSGQHCDITVDNVDLTASTTILNALQFFYHMISGHSSSHGVAVAEGDSGGPVYDYQSGGYAAVGIITGGQTTTPCNSGGTTCFSDVVFSSAYRDFGVLNMLLNN